jgi:hypothetical protein
MGGREIKTAVEIIGSDLIYMNKTEARYRGELERYKLMGLIQWYGFEPIKLRIAKKCYYTPDFIVITAKGQIEAHEVKGFWRDDARVKIKTAARIFPWIAFVAIQYKKGEWKYECF